MNDPVLRLEDVGRCCRRGRERRQVLSGVSFTVWPGEFVGVLGGRGEGKTMLLEIAAGVEAPDDGAVWFEGRDLVPCSAEERAALLGDRIAWLARGDMGGFQAVEYVGLPLAMGRGIGMRASEDRATAALERLGVSDCAQRGWEDLSDWERLLVVFARGYVSRPRLMVLDDLLDALGAQGTRETGELLLSLARELHCGVLAGASDIEALAAADRLLSFDGEGGLTVMAGSDDPTNIVSLHGRRTAGG
jgi:predicted ABC-type transport system involved in lysophospholipase L1 biosynthesis ATPase subunit